MTVPTNNEEAEALVSIMRAANSSEGGVVLRYGDAARAILAAGFRRLPVSGDIAEARAEAERRWPRGWDVEEGTFRDGSVNGFILGAEWQSSQPREAAPSDTDIPTPESAEYAEFEEWEQAMWIHQPVLSIQHGGIVGCQCLDRVFVKDKEDWGSHLASIITARLRTSQPVQVEITDDRVLVSKSTLTYAAGALEGSGDNGDRYCASQIRAALGGGDHAAE